MTENYIIVEKVRESDLETILMNFANLYSETEFVNGIQLYRKKETVDSFMILFSKSPDFERFNYIVNYLKYPEGFENFQAFIRGFYRTIDININAEFITGDWIMVFVSEADKEYDNVSLVNEKNESYLYDFGGKIKPLKQIEEKFNLISTEIAEYNHVIEIFSSKQAETMLKKPWWMFW